MISKGNTESRKRSKSSIENRLSDVLKNRFQSGFQGKDGLHVILDIGNMREAYNGIGSRKFI